MKMLKTIVIVIELVYPMIFFMISPFIDLRIIEGWTSFSLSLSPKRVARVSLKRIFRRKQIKKLET